MIGDLAGAWRIEMDASVQKITMGEIPSTRYTASMGPDLLTLHMLLGRWGWRRKASILLTLLLYWQRPRRRCTLLQLWRMKHLWRVKRTVEEWHCLRMRTPHIRKYGLGGKRKREANESQTNHGWFLMTFNGKFIINVTVVITIQLGVPLKCSWVPL